jgi:CDP-2,3-bis-(O-geranylgeranyl)-sn-glycerol synthase
MVTLKLLLVIGLANGAPIVAENLLRSAWQTPVDFGRNFIDGRPLFGASKTWRGLAAAVATAILGAVAVGFSPLIGLWLGVGAMAGDLLSSCVKRRLGIAPSGMALGLDQIPEVLIPLLLVQRKLALQSGEIVALTALFIVIELMLSRVLFRLHIRKRPY